MDADDTAAGEEGVWEAARTIRPHLHDLIGPTRAAELDRALADQLNAIGDHPAATATLRALLTGDEDTAWFLAEVVADAPRFRPPYQQPLYVRRDPDGRPNPAGTVDVVTAARFSCPHGDYTWYRPEVGSPVPVCPTHNTTLDRA
jgi:plasmid stabilization system protein ParE